MNRQWPLVHGARPHQAWVWYQMMTPDTRHTQASVQITTKTPFSFRCHNNFSAQIQLYNDTAYKTTSAFAFVLQLVQRRSSPSSAVAAAMSFHHSGLLLLFASSFQHVAFVCPNRPQCSHLILLRWGQSLNPAFNAGLTPFNAQTTNSCRFR